jgi:hypothetical protein
VESPSKGLAERAGGRGATTRSALRGAGRRHGGQRGGTARRWRQGRCRGTGGVHRAARRLRAWLVWCGVVWHAYLRVARVVKERRAHAHSAAAAECVGVRLGSTRLADPCRPVAYDAEDGHGAYGTDVQRATGAPRVARREEHAALHCDRTAPHRCRRPNTSATADMTQARHGTGPTWPSPGTARHGTDPTWHRPGTSWQGTGRRVRFSSAVPPGPTELGQRCRMHARERTVRFVRLVGLAVPVGIQCCRAEFGSRGSGVGLPQRGGTACVRGGSGVCVCVGQGGVVHHRARPCRAARRTSQTGCSGCGKSPAGLSCGTVIPRGMVYPTAAI